MSGKARKERRKGRQTPQSTPEKNIKQNDIQDTQDSQDSKPTPKKQQSPSKLTEQELADVPQELKELNLCKALLDLSMSVKKASRTNVFRNEDVIKNLKDANDIFEGWLTPQKSPGQSSSRKKRRRSDQSQNGDDAMKTLEVKNNELEDTVQKTKDENATLQTALEKAEKEIEASKIKQEDELRKKNELIKHINDQYSKMKNNLQREENDHDKTRNDLNRAIENVKDETKKKLEVEKELNEKQEELRKKNEEIESLGNDIISRCDYIEQKCSEISSLKQEMAHMQSQLDEKGKEIDDLRNRLSSFSASKLEGDPNLTDLGDPNRPLKLVDRYQQLYDNLWTDVFDELTESYTDLENDNEKEKKAASDILIIFKEVLQFCTDLVKDQEKSILSTLMCCPKDEVDKCESCIDISAIRSIRKSIADRVLPSVSKVFTRQHSREYTECLKDFTDECVAVCWLSLVQDPPMEYEFDYSEGTPLDKDLMREFTVSGDILEYVVWPTLRLTQGGPVMVKSVVQPIKKQRHDAK